MIRSKRQLIGFLTANHYKNTGGAKHEKWSCGGHSVFVPRHSKGFSMFLGERIAKEVAKEVAKQQK